MSGGGLERDAAYLCKCVVVIHYSVTVLMIVLYKCGGFLPVDGGGLAPAVDGGGLAPAVGCELLLGGGGCDFDLAPSSPKLPKASAGVGPIASVFQV